MFIIHLLLFCFFSTNLLASDEVENTENIKEKKYMGVILVDVPSAVRAQIDLPEGTGLMIHYVYPESPAAKASLATYDVLVKVEGEPLVNLTQLKESIASRAAQDKIQFEILRKGKAQTVELALEEKPENFDRLGELREKLFSNQGKNRHLFNFHQTSVQLAPSTSLDEKRRQFINYIFSQQSTLVYSDQEHQINVENREGKKWLVVKEPATGDLLWEGFVETEEDRKKVPENILKKIEKIDLLRLNQTSTSIDMLHLIENLKSGSRLNIYVTDPDDVERMKKKMGLHMSIVQGQVSDVQEKMGQAKEEADQKDSSPE